MDTLIKSYSEYFKNTSVLSKPSTVDATLNKVAGNWTTILLNIGFPTDTFRSIFRIFFIKYLSENTMVCYSWILKQKTFTGQSKVACPCQRLWIQESSLKGKRIFVWWWWAKMWQFRFSRVPSLIYFSFIPWKWQRPIITREVFIEN